MATMSVCGLCDEVITGVKVILNKYKYACIKCVELNSYKYPDFSPKVKSKNADKSYVSEIDLSHNED